MHFRIINIKKAMKYIKGILILFFFSVCLCQAAFAQQKSITDKKSFIEEKDSLNVVKQNLILGNNALKTRVDSLKNILASLDKDLQKAEYELRLIKRKLYVKRYGHQVADRLINGEIWKGMTEDMVRDSWGKPDKINKNVYKWGVYTQWYYGDVTYFFKNGELFDWQQKK